VAKGDRVYVLAGRIPELYVAALGALKHRTVFCALFSAFGPEPLRTRMSLGGARVLVTTRRLYERKIAALRGQLPSLEHVLLIGDERELTDVAGTLDLKRLMADASPAYTIGPTDPEDAALLHFTSGTTGTPKGALHVHGAVVMHHATGKLVLDLHPGDVFWCTADPGWVTGTSYGILAPLTNGVTMLVDEADFDAERWYEILERERVNVWYTAPTAIRMLMKAGAEPARRRDLRALRFLASVGEPLNPDAVVWSQEVFGRPFHDNWWQTETGGIMIANYASMEVRPGSMGQPLPGVEAAIVRRTAAGGVEVIDAPDVEGELALRPGWPSMFRAYWNDPERYQKCFAGGWYLTGDLARRDADGYFWFVGRADDVIKSAGHLIGPFEVESVLLQHSSVAEAAVIGKPDPIAGEIVKAFVALKPGRAAAPELAEELLGFARKHLGPAVAPRELAFVDAVPRTRSGKILRRLLKARELGLPEGDTSTLEASPGSGLDVTPEHALALLRDMVLVRRFEEKCAELYSAQKIRGFLHLYIGEEAVAAGALRALDPGDAIVASYREHGQALLRGVPPAAVMAEMFGKSTGCARGRGGSMHLFSVEKRFYGGYAIVGGGLPIAVGLALADKIQGRAAVTACFFGDGATEEGEFHEALNLAALWKLPVLFLCENNLYAMGTALARHAADPDLVKRPRAHGIPAEKVDGMDVIAVERAVRSAAEAVRRGEGPRFLELLTYRFRAHSMYDPDRYRDKAEIERWRQRDPIDLFAARLRAEGLASELDVQRIEREVAAEIDAAVREADAAPLEPIEDLTRFVYAREVP
jgi:acetyl-CoA synthetase